ncbi:hypothetical protein AN963_02710 [Brevibacillus choshinensis]|uniref:Uncharacterized protein n=1 Tax=Brevibacillus choshinensis TaxID=54911 RepID=A0ABR5NB09_BRECH|nr:hypothetical protein [Brevibacillus choshinensis]KQL48728.1 hypothetical protein AN963_02710 [Brevibacillus choshinensis]
MVDKFLDEEPISCVIVGTTLDPFSRILITMAGKKGIPNMSLQHGLIGIEEAFMPMFANLNGVFGMYEKE